MPRRRSASSRSYGGEENHRASRRVVGGRSGDHYGDGGTGCGDAESGTRDFAVRDLERLSFARDELPGLEYQHESSGAGAFSEDQEEEGAEEAITAVRRGVARNIEPAEEINAPDLGEQPFGLRGEFDGFPTYSFGWRIGDAIQLLIVAPRDQAAGPESTLELTEQLDAKAEEKRSEPSQ